MVLFIKSKASKSELSSAALDLGAPSKVSEGSEVSPKKRFMPSLNLRILHWKPKEKISKEVPKQSWRPKFNIHSLRRPAVKPRTFMPFQRPFTAAPAVPATESPVARPASASSSLYSRSDRTSIVSMVSMPSLTTDSSMSPPESPIEPMLDERPSTSFERPMPTFERARPASSYEPSIRHSLLKRQDSSYSHRSLSIRRDTARPTSMMFSLPEKTKEPTIAEDDCLVLTMTSKYPTGVAAELYVPEDLSYEVAMQREKELRKAQLRGSLAHNYDLFRRTSTIKSSDEKQRMKRMSINF